MSKTHWKKNSDSRFISGEDLKDGLKGLSESMDVEIIKFEDATTFDQSKQSDVTKTAIWMQDLDTGKKVYKPVLLNKTNSEFLAKEADSPFMEDWIGLFCTLYAKPDSRHGHVVRFKRHRPLPVVDLPAIEAKLAGCKTLADLKKLWDSMPASDKKHPQVLASKDKLKDTLS